jgi:hypothetical protein
MTAISDHGRSDIVEALRAEIIGPDPQGQPLAINPIPQFADVESSYGPWVEAETGEEILNDSRIPPMRRFASGVLFPETQNEPEPILADAPIVDADEEEALDIEVRDGRAKGDSGESNDYELASANELDPRSGAISFVIPEGATSLKTTITGAYYQPFKVKIGGGADSFSERTWYVRRPISFTATADVADLSASDKGFVKLEVAASRVEHPLKIDVYCYSRRLPGRPEEFVTIAVKNNGSGESCNTHGLFQTEFDVQCLDTDGAKMPFPPYPEREDSVLLASDEEARSISLMYREFPTFAVGHGCSADWSPLEGQALTVRGHYFPTHQVPSVTPDITDEADKPLEISMATLAGLDGSAQPFESLITLTDAYERWIDRSAATIGGLATRHHDTAEKHIAECRQMLARMRAGVRLIESDEAVRKAFQYANESVYRQQVETPSETRKVSVDKEQIRSVEPRPFKDVSRLGRWRPFQIGFLLASLPSTADPLDEHRETVELIFFPTGGGKTEAYQALIAFSLFLQRLRGSDQQVGALMRYTLRLLTSQQFTRAAGLICSMELVRRSHGVAAPAFSIGIWVGGSVTPNKRKEALAELKDLVSSRHKDDHHFLLTRCPHCSTDFGKVEKAKGPGAWPAFRESTSQFTGGKKTVVFTCPDTSCPFHSESAPLPVWIVDEDIYERRPSLVIATVDKFAQVAFSGAIGCLFGLDEDGVRKFSPPSLIVQDELHLISGPLGTMVGLYEWLFEEFCIDRRADKTPTKPKIVCSTATIRKFKNQVRGLYARDKAALFPPHGLSVEDSFFARYARDKNGKLEQGRLYVGILGTSLRSVQDLQVRVTASLLQAPKRLQPALQDPWFTLLSFFNRISDIGTTFNLLQVNVTAYLKTIWSRQGISPESGLRRYLNSSGILELTSRIKDSELPTTIDRLFSTVSNNPIDTCLASNIIEVGVDIPRLSLLSILGQPKTTSQYIQVTGRVGRLWQQKPGLVVTMYPPRRPRDRSHFEKFRAFHQRLYASVEPTSVTPFSSPAMERALHAVIVGYVRNYGSRSLKPIPVPDVLINPAIMALRERVAFVDSRQLADFDAIEKKRRHEWVSWLRTEWDPEFNEDVLPLLYRSGTHLPTEKKDLAWATPPTMRNVDAECIARISDIYVRREAARDG